MADKLTIEAYRVTSRFPACERYGLVSQIRRASVSIPTNIVEGSARSSEREYLRFLGIAFSSAREVGYLIDLSKRLGFVSGDDADTLMTLQGRTASALIAHIRSLSR